MNDHSWHARDWQSGQPLRLTVRDGRILSCEKSSAEPGENIWFAPLLFDPQINGYAAVDFQQDDLSLERLLEAVRALRRDGCNRFLLTLITDAWTPLMRRLRHLRALRESHPVLREAIHGWHVEGPFLSDQPGFHGAHPPEWMRDPTPGLIQELRTLTGNDPLLLTIAPERESSLDAIRAAVALGIRVSLGHTDASAQRIAQAIAAGASGFTHLGNGCPRQLDRHDNILWRVLEQRSLQVSFIPDQLHVSPALFRIAHRLLDPESIVYTTDAMAAAGAGPGTYRIGPITVAVGPDEIVRQPGQTNFAGSALRPIEGPFRAARMLGCRWQDVWAGFSQRPAQWMGAPASLAPGDAADFLILTCDAGNQCTGVAVVIAGEELIEAWQPRVDGGRLGSRE